jgi:hypothetical protein
MRHTYPSNDIKEEILYFIDQLLNHGAHPNLSRSIQIQATWNKENLKIVTTIDHLIQLLPSEATIDRTITQQKNHLAYLLNKILNEQLKILRDDRPKNSSDKLQGIKAGRFTLKLWYPPTQPDYITLNNCALERHWNKTFKITPSILPPLHNLPPRRHSKYIGRNTEHQELLNLLSLDRQQIIEIVGMAGVGKTSLALEVAYQSLTDPTLGKFTAIIFSSAQSQQILGSHITPRYLAERDLQDLLQVISRTIKQSDILPAETQAQILHIREIIGDQKILIIIDNIENLTQPQEMIAFLGCLPPNVKAIITSRERLGIGQVINLDPLPVMESLDLIKHQARSQNLKIDHSTQLQHIQKITGGLPLAITYLISSIATTGFTILNKPQPLVISDFAHYCFSQSIEQLRNLPDQIAYHLLLSLSLFPDGATTAALTYIIQLADPTTETNLGLQQLYQSSLAFPTAPGKYNLHSLTQEYAQLELHKQPELASQTLNRWRSWHLELVAPYGQLDWQDWQDYSPLITEWKNLRAVIDWSIEQEKYADVLQFWQCIKGVSLLGGYWPDRERWLQWLQTKADQQQDLPTIAELKYHRSFTLGFLNESDEDGQAIALALAAWELHPHLSIDRQFDLMMYIACLRIRKPPSHPNRAADLASAQDWLDRGLAFLATFPTDHPRYHRSYFQFHYYQAEIHLIEGQTDLAYDHYQEANQIAKKAGSKRFTQFSSVRMAMILLQRGELAAAKKRLIAARKLTKEFHDRRAGTFCLKNLAEIEKAQGNLAKAQEFAEQAKANFKKLRMYREAAMVDRFLQDLNTDLPDHQHPSHRNRQNSKSR